MEQSAQEAIIYHTDRLLDSLIAYCLSPSNQQFQVYPYKGIDSNVYNECIILRDQACVFQ
jgi:hypothetical protein